jgi:hypothetical protein
LIARTREKTVNFANVFVLKGIDRPLPAGKYSVKTDEELIEGVSFPVYRRIATRILVPAQSPSGAMEMVTIDPVTPREALVRDAGSADQTGVNART